MMAEPIRIRARHRDGLTEVVLLMPHPMETGLRKNAAGGLVATHYITDVRVAVEGRPVLEARMSHAVSQDPLLTFRFRGGKPGERITASWLDSLGQTRADASLIA